MCGELHRAGMTKTKECSFEGVDATRKASAILAWTKYRVPNLLYTRSEISNDLSLREFALPLLFVYLFVNWIYIRNFTEQVPYVMITIACKLY